MAAREEILVVGAGISGLCAALLLARAGRRVRVIERAPRAGGLAGAEHFRGIPCDLGSHRLHPAALDQPLLREIHRAEPFLERPRRGVLIFNDCRLPYPVAAPSMLRALGLRASLSLAWGLVARAGQRRAFAAWDRDRAPRSPDGDVGFERFVRDRVGDPAYRAFYRPYAEKVWGLDPRDLSQTVAKKRVSTTRPWALVRARDAERASFVYPARGASSIVEWLARELEALRVPIDLGRAFDPAAQRRGPALFAGDLADLVPTSLAHRGLYLVYLALPIARVSDEETYYSPDPRYWFGRVSELQNYSPALRNDGETILCVEIPEGRWGTGADFAHGERLAALRAQLEHAGIVPRGVAPIEVRQRFVPRVYPLYRRGWLAEWRRAMRAVAALGDVIPFGRQALFLHCNLDHCAAIAAEAVDHLASGAGADAWIDRAAAWLDVPVRD